MYIQSSLQRNWLPTAHFLPHLKPTDTLGKAQKKVALLKSASPGHQTTCYLCDNGDVPYQKLAVMLFNFKNRDNVLSLQLHLCTGATCKQLLTLAVRVEKNTWKGTPKFVFCNSTQDTHFSAIFPAGKLAGSFGNVRKQDFLQTPLTRGCK